MHEEMSVYVFVAIFVCVQIEMFVFTHGDNSVYAHVNACGDVCVFVHMEEKGKHQLSSFNISHHGFEASSLTEPGDHQFGRTSCPIIFKASLVSGSPVYTVRLKF